MPLIEPDTANPDGPFNLLLALAEWADVVVDLNGAPAGSNFILYNGRRRFPLGEIHLTTISQATQTKAQQAVLSQPARLWTR